MAVFEIEELRFRRCAAIKVDTNSADERPKMAAPDP
jgi:hypothetical protein